MCQALPGLRCASHLRKNLATVLESLTAVKKELHELNKIAHATDEQLPDDQLDRWYALNDQQKALHLEIGDLQNQYDMTRTGRKELSQQIQYLTAMGDPRNQVPELETMLSAATYRYQKATELAKDQIAGLEQYQNITGEDRAGLDFHNARAKVAFKEMDDILERGILLNGNKTLSRNDKEAHAKIVAMASAGNRANAGTKALKDDSYEPGIYGVFHGHDGSIYLSKALDNDRILNNDRLAFANGRENTAMYPRDEYTVLVEKTADGQIAHNTKHYGKLIPARRTFSKIGTASQHILQEVPEQERPQLTAMAKRMQDMLEANPNDSRSVGEVRLAEFEAKNPTEKKHKSVLLRAYKYALYSPAKSDEA